MEIDNKLVAAILTYIKYKNYTSWLADSEVASTYMDILKRIKENDDEVKKPDYWFDKDESL